MGDNAKQESYNCLEYKHTWERAFRLSWEEWECKSAAHGCPCQYQRPPVLRLRGTYQRSIIEHLRYIPKQVTGSNDVMFVARFNQRIWYDNQGRWSLYDRRYGLVAVSYASKESYLLGKNNWTISFDMGKCKHPYDRVMKLTGCKDGEFTCDDGQCVTMEERCDQLPHCGDKSDEVSCSLVHFEKNYNKRIPPISTTKGVLNPAQVDLSITLERVVSILEEEHAIELQFEIILDWQENRATYKNIKSKASLNALSDQEKEDLWLPLVIYANTDQKQSTRLGTIWEWKTSVIVQRQGNFTRSGLEELDETEVFKGAENSLRMQQTYTHEFQCVYDLNMYPFDTQVAISAPIFYNPLSRSAR